MMKSSPQARRMLQAAGDGSRSHAERLFVRLLRDAGIATELHEVDGAYHGFVQAEGTAPVAREYVARMKAALERAWHVT